MAEAQSVRANRFLRLFLKKIGSSRLKLAKANTVSG